MVCLSYSKLALFSPILLETTWAAALKSDYNTPMDTTPLYASLPAEGFRAGFVAVAGRPNVGKSTLINALLGQKIAAVSPRPQTTRRQQFGILSLPEAQLVFMDTPGIHHPRHKLGELMNEEAAATFREADVVLVVVDGSEPPHEEDRFLSEVLAAAAPRLPLVLAVNKIDVLFHEALSERQVVFQALFPQAFVQPISAARGDELPALLAALLDRLPENSPFFSDDQITDFYERDIAADLIREAALIHLRDEVPHSLAVRIDEFTERDNGAAFIAATLFVERESQKGIVIGKGGGMLKTIGSHARGQIEAVTGRHVFLRLRVKLRENWRNDENTLRLFGFKSQN